VAIQDALRELPYSLDVPSPPPGREIVSWFLGDLRRGYCDYFATAMVVLARAEGIPARLAVGYATGDYDAEADTYVVTELNAHSWPELYFPGRGWVAFEPTPAQPAPERMGELPPGEVMPDWAVGEQPDMEGELAELRQLAETRAAEESRWSALQRALALLNGLVAAWAGWLWYRKGRGVPEDEPGSRYAGLVRWGSRLGRPPHAWETAREYAAAVSEAARRAATRSLARPAASKQSAAIVQAQSQALAEEYETARFAPPAERAALNVQASRWRSLWAALRRLWLAGRWRI
jgi:hypothetical protein